MRYLAALRVGVRFTGPSFHMTRARGIASASFAVFAVAAVIVILGPAPVADARPVAASSGSFAGALLRIQNSTRHRYGLRRLGVSRDLTRAARRHARDMVRGHYFGHVSHGGHDVVDRVGATGYGRKRFSVQENLYWWSRRRSAAAVIDAWMGSAVHRANILHRGWREFGIAVLPRSPFGRGGVTVVCVYGSHR